MCRVDYCNSNEVFTTNEGYGRREGAVGIGKSNNIVVFGDNGNVSIWFGATLEGETGLGNDGVILGIDNRYRLGIFVRTWIGFIGVLVVDLSFGVAFGRD